MDENLDSSFLIIDGSFGEGGGSIVRLGCGFASLLQIPINIKNIRANRTPPGLKTQHLMGLKALEILTNGKLSNANVGTTEIKFIPGQNYQCYVEIQIDTAGSIALLCQILQNACIKKKNHDEIKVKIIGGGTFGTGAPDPYYLNNVTYRYFSKMGYNCKINVSKEGFYPKGGGSADLIINPIKEPEKNLKPLNLLNRGDIIKIGGSIIVSENLRKPRVAERVKEEIIKLISQKNQHLAFDIKEKYVQTLNPGVGLNIWAEYDSGCVLGSGTILGERGVPSEEIARRAVRSLYRQIDSGATIDEFLADQIIPLLYLCEKSSVVVVPEITSHMKTNIDLLELFKKRDYHIEKFAKGWKLEYL